MKKIKLLLAFLFVLIILCSFAACTPVEVDPCANGHDWDDGSRIYTDCTQTGKLIRRCKVCGSTLEQEIPATEHVWDMEHATVTQQPTCGKTGKYSVKCSVCEVTQEDVIPPTGQHVWDNGTILSGDEPGCEKEGTLTFTCTECNQTTTQSLPASGHVYGELINEVPATCAQAGTMAHWQCSECDKLFVENNGVKKEVDDAYLTIQATGSHDWKYESNGDGTHTVTCGVCHETSSESCTPDDGDILHDITHGLAKGYYADVDFHWQICKYCGEKTRTNHTFIENPDTTKSCSVCGHKFFEILVYKGSDTETVAHSARTLKDAFDWIAEQTDTAAYTISFTHNISDNSGAIIEFNDHTVLCDLNGYSIESNATLKISSGSLTVSGGTFAVGSISYSGGALDLPAGNYEFVLAADFQCGNPNVHVTIDGEPLAHNYGAYSFDTDNFERHTHTCKYCGNLQSDWCSPDKDNHCDICGHSYTAQEIMNALYNLSDGETLHCNFALQGTVTKIEDDFGQNLIAIITVDGVVGQNNALRCTMAKDAKVVVGAHIKVSGTLMHTSDGEDVFAFRDLCNLDDLTYPTYTIGLDENGSEQNATLTVTDIDGSVFARTQTLVAGTVVQFRLSVVGGKIVSVNVGEYLLVPDGNGIYNFTVQGDATIIILVGGTETATYERAEATVGAIADRERWDNQRVPSFYIDETHVVQITSESGNGDDKTATHSYETNQHVWKLYQIDEGTMTVSVPDGYVIVAVTVNYVSHNDGYLICGSDKVKSGTTYILQSAEQTFVVFGVGSADQGETDGQVWVQSISVTYKFAIDHKFGDWIEATSATCESPAFVGHYLCSAHKFCEGKFYDKEGNIIDNQVEAPALGHMVTLIETSDPTCQTAGYRQHFRCSVCGNCFDSEEDAKQNINFHPESYYKTSDIVEHSFEDAWQSDLSQHWHKCKWCDTTDEKTDHGYTCSSNGEGGHSGVCSECGREEDNLPHSLLIIPLEGDAARHLVKCTSCEYAVNLLHNFQDESGNYTQDCICGEKRVQIQKAEITADSIGLTGGLYPDTAQNHTHQASGLQFTVYYLMKRTGIQFHQGDGYILNATPFSGRIVKIVVNYNTVKTLILSVGSDADSLTEVTLEADANEAATGTAYSWQNTDGADIVYFKLLAGSEAVTLNSVTVYYEIETHTYLETSSEEGNCKEGTKSKVQYTCIRCGNTYETEEDVRHKLTQVPYKEATCEEDGNIRHFKCEVCGKKFYDDYTYNLPPREMSEGDEVILSSGHKIESPQHVCEDGVHLHRGNCSTCGKSVSQQCTLMVIQSDSTMHQLYCTVCHWLGDLESHTPDENGVCIYCGHSENTIAAVGGKPVTLAATTDATHFDSDKAYSDPVWLETSFDVCMHFCSDKCATQCDIPHYSFGEQTCFLRGCGAKNGDNAVTDYPTNTLSLSLRYIVPRCDIGKRKVPTLASITCSD